VAAEVCEALGLATEPRTVTPGRRPVMEIAVVPHELIRWTARRRDQIAACMAELEHEYVTAVDDDGESRFLPVVSERARAKLNQIAARKTRPPKQSARPLAQLRAWWKASAILTSGVAADVITSLLEHPAPQAGVAGGRERGQQPLAGQPLAGQGRVERRAASSSTAPPASSSKGPTTIRRALDPQVAGEVSRLVTISRPAPSGRAGSAGRAGGAGRAVFWIRWQDETELLAGQLTRVAQALGLSEHLHPCAAAG
jgi:hypothetical protein